MIHGSKGSAKRLVNRIGRKCFYTGLECAVPESDNRSNNSDMASREHLITKKRKYSGYIKHNSVVSLRAVNNTVGNAPLRVKFMIKKQLTEFAKTLPEKMHNTQKAKLCAEHINKIYDEFRVFNRLPWEWNNIDKKNERAIMRRVYIELLTPEERWVIFGELQ